jgi:hypothetical protein
VDDLIAFLTARLDEDEAAANEVHRPRDCGSVDRDGDFDPDPVYCGCGRPDRERREVAAKRAILTQVVPQIVEMDQQIISEWGSSRDEPDEHLPLLKIMAAVYSDHPDYRAEWATPAA